MCGTGTDPAVVVQRVRGLNRWLTAAVELFQFADAELIRFLNLPVYLALRVMIGDFCEDEYAEVTHSLILTHSLTYSLTHCYRVRRGERRMATRSALYTYTVRLPSVHC